MGCWSSALRSDPLAISHTSSCPFSPLLVRPPATSARKYTYYAILLIGWGGLWNSDFRLFSDRQDRQFEKLHKSTKPPCQILEPCGIAGRELEIRLVCDTVESRGCSGWRMDDVGGESGWPIPIVIEILIDEVTLCDEGRECIPKCRQSGCFFLLM